MLWRMRDKLPRRPRATVGLESGEHLFIELLDEDEFDIFWRDVQQRVSDLEFFFGQDGTKMWFRPIDVIYINRTR